MKKDNNNRRKLAIGAVLAAGMTTGAMTACTGSEARNAGNDKTGTEVTAADKVVVEGREVVLDDSVPKPNPHQARPMYGVRERPIRLLYGPRPRPGFDNRQVDDAQLSVIEPQVLELVTNVLGVDAAQVQTTSNLSRDLNITEAQKKELKAALEDRFNVNIEDDTFKMMKTVSDLVNCIIILKN
ncbi:MAG: acyl carrier protein [Muribaculaceae bacterium]|nr:acyl carrier protein [Muribaculaceae bacterium]